MNETVAKTLGGHPRGRRRILFDRFVAVIMLFALIVLPVSFFVGGPALLKSYDAAHLIKLRCTIRSSELNKTSSRSTGGIGTSGAEVLLDTSCGRFVYVDGVTLTNGDQVADRFRSGSVQTFSVGKGSVANRGLLEFFHLLPAIQESVAEVHEGKAGLPDDVGVMRLCGKQPARTLGERAADSRPERGTVRQVRLI